MRLPKKALKESQLKYLTAGSAVDDGSHQIFRVTFIEKGIQKSAFFKKLDPARHYPELLAKISVATSVFKRIFQGQNSAEERLVFNDEEQLIGTLSISIDGFKPFHFANEQAPLDPDLKEQVIPSTQTLIAKNAMEILLGRWFLDDDDAHPHNLGFSGDNTVDIDFDMFWYWFTIYMKEPRPVIGVPKKRISLSVRDWETFPNAKDAKHYHCPTYHYPGQETLPIVMSPVQGALFPKILPKSYADPTQFQLLANNPIAQEQKLAAALKALLTYNPDMARARLIEYFDEMSLNYTSLDATDIKLRVKYEEEFPLLCNQHTNVQPFVDFMLALYQEHYDNLYRIVVFYMGCANNGYGVPLLATSIALYQKPSFYRTIMEWVKKQNETVHIKDDVTVSYNLVEVQKKYHQVWRDAIAPNLKQLLHDSFHLTNKLIKVASSIEVMPEILGKKTTDDSVTSAWQLFGTMPELSVSKIESSISIDKDSNLRDGLFSLVAFTNEFHAIAKNYYTKEYKELTEEDNLLFVKAIAMLYSEYNLTIRKSLAHTTSFANEFNRIAVSLNDFAERANFQLHLTTTDVQIKETSTAMVLKDALPYNHEDVLRQFNDSLFLWAKNQRPDELSRLINDIIDNYYAPRIKALSLRYRADPVKIYLASSMKESGENRLAYILSSGTDIGALNTCLIQYLTPYVLQTHYLPSIRNAVKNGLFEANIALYARSTTSFAKTDPRFVHIYSMEGIALFYKTMFDWIDKLPKAKFEGLIESGLKAYEAKLWWFDSRREEVKGYCKTSRQVKALAMTFLKGSDSSTLNDVLFHKIISAIKEEASTNVTKQNELGYRLILQYDPDVHKVLYLPVLKQHSAAPSHEQEFLDSSIAAGCS